MCEHSREACDDLIVGSLQQHKNNLLNKDREPFRHTISSYVFILLLYIAHSWSASAAQSCFLRFRFDSRTGTNNRLGNRPIISESTHSYLIRPLFITLYLDERTPARIRGCEAAQRRSTNGRRSTTSRSYFGSELRHPDEMGFVRAIGTTVTELVGCCHDRCRRSNRQGRCSTLPTVFIELVSNTFLLALRVGTLLSVWV